MVLPGCPGEAGALGDLLCHKEEPGTPLEHGATLKPITLCWSLLTSPRVRLAVYRQQKLLESVLFGTTEVPSANTGQEKLLFPGSEYCIESFPGSWIRT